MRLFECGIRYEKTLENGMQKKVTELLYRRCPVIHRSRNAYQCKYETFYQW
jgi:hypothetical protein